MSSFKRRNLLLSLAALPLAGCGFQPVYGENAAASGLRGRLGFNLIESPEGFLLRDVLERRYGDAGAGAEFLVEIELDIEESDLVLVATTGLTRVTVNGEARVTVKRRGDDAPVLFRDRLRETVGYSSGPETLVTKAARRDARERLARALAERIALRLGASAGDWAQ